MLYWSAAFGRRGPDLSGWNVAGKIGDECDAFAVRGPSHIAERKIAFHSDRVRRSATCRNYGEFSIHHISDLRSVGRERNLIDLLGVRHGVKQGCGARRCGGSVLREKGRTDDYGCNGAKQHRT